MASRLSSAALVVGLVLATAGCTTSILLPPSESALDKLLTQVTTSSDSVALEIFHARIPIDKENRAEAIWGRVDEQCFDVELRKRLLKNGLRAGVVGAPLPEELSDLLALESTMPASDESQIVTALSATPQVTRRVVQVSRRELSSIQASELRPRADVLVSDESGLHGSTYEHLQPAYTLKAQSTPGQRVKIELVPELQHGELKNRYAGSDQGIFTVVRAREKVVFDRLAMSVDLASGEMLLLGCLPDATTTLGGVFHSPPVQGRHERKIILIRALATPPSEILADKVERRPRR